MADLSNKGDQDVRIKKPLIAMNENTITQTIQLPQYRNSISYGTVFIANGITVTVPTQNAIWFITEV